MGTIKLIVKELKIGKSTKIMSKWTKEATEIKLGILHTTRNADNVTLENIISQGIRLQGKVEQD